MTKYEVIDAPGGQSARAGYVPCAEEDDLARHLLRPCFPADREILLIAAFDAFDRLLCLERADGDRSGRCVIPPRCWRALLDVRPASVTIAHNHPSGIARPSDADIATTGEAARFLALPGIVLSDHLIFIDAGHFSFRCAGLL